VASFWAFIKSNKWPTRGAPTARRFVVLTWLFLLLGAALLYAALWKTSKRFSYPRPLAGGTITEGVIGAPRFINPLLATNPTDEELVSLIYSGLVKETSNGTLDSDLATFTRTPDGARYTFTIKANAKFSDNKPVTVDDVLFTYDLVQQGLGPSALGSAVHAMTFEKIDDRTLTVILTDQSPKTLYALTLGILPQHVWSTVSAAEMRDAPQETSPIGSGPFKLDRTLSKGGVPSMLLLKRNTHALTPPLLKRYNLAIFANEAAMTSAINDGTIDVTDELSAAAASTITPKGDYIVKAATTAKTVALYARPDNALLRDNAFRGAFSTAVDRNKLIATIEDGYGSAVSATSDSSPSASTTFDDLIASHALSRSPSGALSRSGVPIDIAIAVESGTKENAVANALHDEFADLGIAIDVHAYDSGTWRTVLANKEAGAVLATSDTPLEGYALSIPLYVREQPIIIKKTYSFLDIDPIVLETLHADASSWYMREERVWNLFKRND
jgi:peptide/nickel transport system substrate-binding protein